MGFSFLIARCGGLSKQDQELIEAAWQGRTADVKALIAAGADVDVMATGFPLRIAAFSGRAKTVEALLEAGADLHLGDDAALQTAKRRGHLEVVKILEDRINGKEKPLQPTGPHPT
jgi:ankyrin repeat protein